MTPEQRTNLLSLIAALRSGRYAQTQDLLHDAKGYCCQGVACELYYGPGAWRTKKKKPSNSEQGVFALVDGGQFRGWPWKVCEAFGLSWVMGEHLVEMNDSGSTFDQIAQHLEEYLAEPELEYS